MSCVRGSRVMYGVFQSAGVKLERVPYEKFAEMKFSV